LHDLRADKRGLYGPEDSRFEQIRMTEMLSGRVAYLRNDFRARIACASRRNTR
jgi:hypothetical protein